MKAPVENIRLSQKAKDQLIQVKRKTGIDNWNVLCRWALCISLAERSNPAPAEIPGDSNLEMSWKTFSGDYTEMYSMFFCEHDDSADSSELFRLHLHRGIGYLHNKLGKQEKYGDEDPLFGMVAIQLLD